MTKPLRQTIQTISLAIKAKRILEIGSRQEKGQKQLANLRSFFPDSDYVGTDMRSGPGVDLVANAYHLPFKDKRFDLILCLETLEHAEQPWLIAGEIHRLLKPKGLAVISSQQNFPLHFHPNDYFRYTPFGLASLFKDFKQKLVFSVSPPFDNEVKLNPQIVIALVWKQKNLIQKRQIRQAIIKAKGKISVHKPYRHRLFDCLKFFKRGLQELVFRQEISFFE